MGQERKEGDAPCMFVVLAGMICGGFQERVMRRGSSGKGRFLEKAYPGSDPCCTQESGLWP
eukprot:5548538-Prymnesium_polylepis.1